MHEGPMSIAGRLGPREETALALVHTLVIGSGAAGLNAAVQLRASGIDDLLIVTEGLAQGTSINTGSDKQTYYKLAMHGAEGDAPATMAESYLAGGSMHGDLALVEASLSARAFLHLVELGVPFPRDAYGQFVGYKTDHDPRQRTTSIGPYTSREMCRALIRRVRALDIPVWEDRRAVRLLTVEENGASRVVGAVLVRSDGAVEVVGADNVVFAVGGPGGLYHTSVYPSGHTGSIGVALLAGAEAQNLPESQFGIASTQFRWNVSGTYMQVVPRLVSTAADGTRNAREFLLPFFPSPGAMHSAVFLKGYQWPFDARKVIGGSSLVDLLVFQETVLSGRRMFLDFRANAEGFRFENLSEEAQNYLTRSRAIQATPLERLRAMNPAAVELYREHGIDLASQPLEIAVCAQHNNGGLAGNLWWESVNVKHLFPVGEVNGSHGVYRPGGSALNAGQVGGLRTAEYIGHRYRASCVGADTVRRAAEPAIEETLAWIRRSASAAHTSAQEREDLQRRMTLAAAQVRGAEALEEATLEAWEQWNRMDRDGCRGEPWETLHTRQLCFAHAVYLDAVRFWLGSGVGSRGSAIVLGPGGTRIHEQLDDRWRLVVENPEFRTQVLRTLPVPEGRPQHAWVPSRPLPQPDDWFETVWARYRQDAIYDEPADE